MIIENISIEMFFVLVYFVWNLITFFIMGIDTLKAKYNRWRISENLLLGVSFALGGVGTSAGAYIFKHKTRKMKFRILLPLSVIVNFATIYGIYVLFNRVV